MKKSLLCLFSLLSGVIGVFAFSPFDIWGLAYVSLFALITIIKTQKHTTALLGAFCWGLGFFSVGVSWLHVSIYQFGGAPLVVSYLLVVLLAAYLSFYPVLFAYLIHRFQINSLILFPILWTFTEFLRGWIFTGFPWLQFGYSQIDSPFSGIAPIFGVTGLTFFVMWVSAALFSLFSALWRSPRKWHLALAHGVIVSIIAVVSAYSSQKNYVQEMPEKALTITLAQGNIEQNLKWDPAYLQHTLAIYQLLITQHLGKSDLIILPESAFPTLENYLQSMLQSLQQAAEKSQTEVMIGSVYRDENIEKLFNSIIVVGNSSHPYDIEKAQRYSKHHLVPFGEYVPLESLLRPLGSVFNLPMSAFQSGDEIQAPLMAKNRIFTPAICYEVILGAQLQKNLRPNTDFLLTISNDAWFGDSIGPWQHLQMARMRALELGKPLVRATNTGISVFINAQGKIIAQAPQFIETTLTQKLNPTTGKTPYAVFGDIPLYILSIMFALLHFIAGIIKQKLLKRAVAKNEVF